MTNEEQLTLWLLADTSRMAALMALRSLHLPEAYLAAGFIRNLVWDRLHGYYPPTPLTDLDVIYFDPDDCREERDRNLEALLTEHLPAPWSVKNQARMHHRNGDAPYTSTADAMSYWVEVETAVGVCLDQASEPVFCAPLGLSSLMAGELTLNPKRSKPDDFYQRLTTKQWLQRWPALKCTLLTQKSLHSFGERR